MEPERVHQLALDYLAFEGGQMRALTMLDAVMSAAADLTLKDLRTLCFFLSVPERPRYNTTNSSEDGMRLGDLRKYLAARRQALVGG